MLSLPFHLLLVFVAFAAAVASQGGYYPPGRFLVTALVVLALFVALYAYGRPERWWWPLLAACAALAAWAVVGAAASGSVVSAGPTAATLACVAAAALVVSRADAAQRQLCAGVTLGVGVLVAVSGWVGVAWRVEPFALATDERLWRATSTLTYANAAAALLAPLAVLSVALLLGRPRSLLHLGTTYLLLVGLGATLSRAGALACLVGLAVLAGLAGVRATVRAVLPILIGAVVAVGGLAPSSPVTAREQPLLAAAALAAGLAVALAGTWLPRRARAVALLASVAAAGAVATGVSATGMDILADSRAHLRSPTRADSAQAALQLVADRPLTGVGPGQAVLTWTLPDGRVVSGRYAHNEYLQVLVELGAVGLLLLLAVLVAVVLVVRRGRPGATSPLLWAGATAGLVALLVHSGFDFLWQLPVIPLAGALLAGLAGPAFHIRRGPAEKEEK
ncbi:MAG TPA: O-antigen ligase family protein [Micromonosporaceae bacterium]|nr:O-antigen ligase family protein [Micromonosporaceae bacterium]